MNRRVFLTRGASLVFFVGCGAQIAPSDLPPNPDIVLEGDENALSSTLSKSFGTIANLIEGKRENIRVGFEDILGENEVMTLSLASDAGAAYKHPVLETESLGSAHLVGGTKNLLPSFKAVDESGETLKRDGRPLEFGLDLGDIVSSLRAAPAAAREEIVKKVLGVGIKAVAAVLALWFGLTLASHIAGALAAIVFVVLALAVLAAVTGTLDEALVWISQKTGLSVIDIQQFFEKAPDKIAELLRETADFVEEKL